MSQTDLKTRFAPLMAAIDARKAQVYDYLLHDEFAASFRPDHIHDAAYSYVKMGGKSLRAAVLMMCCGAVGGDETQALPAAAAVELYHTWTLVHDDIIDKDDRRRGAPTVHTEFAQRATTDLGWEGADAQHYGLSIAILTGDIQQAWSWSLLFRLHSERGVDSALVLQLATELATYVQPNLVEGETLDVQFSRSTQRPTEAAVLDMLWKKTGVLYEYAGRAGAAIGLGDVNRDIPIARALASFCSLCGTAFQIQDDILGVVGDAGQLGKPVGSDIREGKNTILTLKAIERASPESRAVLDQILGDSAASPDAVAAVTKLMRDLEVIDYARQMAQDHVNRAFEQLEVLPESAYKQLLSQWAEYIVAREF